MRAGIDGRAFRSPAAGVRRYVTELARAFARRGDVSLVAIGAGPEEALPEGVTRQPEPPSPPTNLGRHAVGLPLAIARAGVELYHAPAYTAPCWGRVPVVLTLHDVSYARRPEFYPYRRDPLRRAFYAWSAKRARLILTISEFSRGEIVEAYGIDPARVRVVYLGVDPRFAPDVPEPEAWLARVRGRRIKDATEAPTRTQAAARAQADAGPYLLHVGDLHERRNLRIAVRALAAVRARHADNALPADRAPLSRARLVLAGVDRGVAAGLIDEARQLGQPDLLELVGTVSEERLLALYRGASALVYPSRYEGFGFPIVEAMASGAPVLAARASASPEVVGEAGLLLDPDREEEWRDAIDAVLVDDARALAMREAGFARAARFTWDRTAAGTVDAYRACLASPQGALR